jgi:hypothetical protein
MSDKDQDLLSKMNAVASQANAVSRRKEAQVTEETTYSPDVQNTEYDRSSKEADVVMSTPVNKLTDVEVQQIEAKPADPSIVKDVDVDFEKMLENFDKIKIIDNGIQATQTINRFINTKPTYNVVALQSAYEAKMSALTMVDKSNIRNSTDTPHAVRRKIYEIIYNHIETMSVQKPAFEDWLKVTSYWDVETLLFGIYAQTYSHNNSFDITCPVCKEKNRVRADAEVLVQVRDPDSYQQVRDIIAEVSNWTELKGKSQVGQTIRFMLPKSKTIVIAKSPSLYEHLNMLKSYNPSIPSVGEVFAFSLFIKELLIPDMDQVTKGNAVFAKVTGRDDIHRVVTKMNSDDEDYFNDKIRELSDKFKIEFALEKFNCTTPGCTKEFDQIPLDIENLLFFRIIERQS